MGKFYFRVGDEEYCYTKKYWKEFMKENSLDSIELVEAKRDCGNEYFYCRFHHEVGMVGEGCGKQCDAYKPRNGKNGRCVHSGYCYETTENKIILKQGVV
jgi:hypothetical protein